MCLRNICTATEKRQGQMKNRLGKIKKEKVMGWHLTLVRPTVKFDNHNLFFYQGKKSHQLSEPITKLPSVQGEFLVSKDLSIFQHFQ